LDISLAGSSAEHSYGCDFFGMIVVGSSLNTTVARGCLRNLSWVTITYNVMMHKLASTIALQLSWQWHTTDNVHISLSCSVRLKLINPLTPLLSYGYSTAVKHIVPDRIKPSFVIFDIRALWRSGLSVRVPGCQKLQMTA